jgi:hypothetical protein
MKLTDEQEAFLQKLASGGAAEARRNNLPVSAMLACACQETSFGTHGVFLQTNNPFHLQKWPWVLYPTSAGSLRIRTNVAPPGVPEVWRVTFFNTAPDLPDAVRQWCEWILHYGEADGPPGNENPHFKQVAVPAAKAKRDRLLALRDKPVEFADNLLLVGFGNSVQSHLYSKCITDNSLTRFDDPLYSQF